MEEANLGEAELSILQEGAAQLHEMYLTFRASGFTEYQALILVAEMIRPRSG